MGFNEYITTVLSGAGRKLFVETYGCQMNVGDTEVVVRLCSAVDTFIAGGYRPGRCHPDQHLLDPRQRRAAHLGPSGRDETLPPRQTGARRGRHRLHGRTPGREAWSRTPGVDVVVGRTLTATCRAWCARPRRAARVSTCCSPRRRPMPKSPPCGASGPNGVSAPVATAGVRQQLFLPRGPLHPRPRTEPPRCGDHRCRARAVCSKTATA